MKSEAKAKYLVVDTTGFIRNLQLQELAENVISLEEVVNEIKCHKQLKRLAVLPYDLTVKAVFPENVKAVTEFSKKTGDFPSLSSVDMKVMGLTYQLEKEFVGIDHIKTSPEIQTTIENYNPAEVSFDNVAGFYNKDKMKVNIDGESVVDDAELIIQNMKELEVCDEAEKDFQGKSEKSNSNSEEVNQKNDKEPEKKDMNSPNSSSKTKENGDKLQMVEESIQKQEEAQSSEQNIWKVDNGLEKEEIKSQVTTPDSDYKDDLTPSPPDDQIELGYSSDDEGDSTISDDNLFDDDDKNVKFEPSEDLMVLKRIEQNSQECDDISDDDSIYDDDDCGWITPSNIAQAKRESAAGVLSDDPVTVACLTTDFAMQNVLLQMGLNVMAVDGRIIKQVRTYIQRCHACGKTTSIMTKLFCPKCGLKTLKRVAVSVDPDGKQHIYINYKRQITARGKRWAIPKPQGGKHANNPILVEDQRIPQQRLSKKAMQRTNALEPDYIAGFSPFVMKDTTSRSVMLGFHTSRQNTKHLVGRNPSKRSSKKKK